MSLIGLLIAIVIIAVIFWVLSMIPIPEPFKKILFIVVGLIVLLWLLGALGVVDMGPVIHFERK